jgi:nucleotide-binding universal stress UspA family protein
MRYQRIVIGVDFSTASLNAVRWVASRFAPHAQLFLAHVVARPRVPSFVRSIADPLDEQDVEEPTLYPGLTGFAAFAEARRAEVTIRRGQPADELAALAREVDADLICVGRSQKRRGTGRFGATTPQRLLARTRLSVLLVPSVPRLHPTSVLAAVSDGAEAERVLEETAALASEWDARVDVLHAFDAGTRAPRTTNDGEPDLRRLAESWLTRRAGELPELTHRATAIGHAGDAAEAILVHAATANSDLIVMGRRTFVEPSEDTGGCVGSTTRLITWTTPCPVLVVGTHARDRPRRERNARGRAGRWEQDQGDELSRSALEDGLPTCNPVHAGGSLAGKLASDVSSTSWPVVSSVARGR